MEWPLSCSCCPLLLVTQSLGKRPLLALARQLFVALTCCVHWSIDNARAGSDSTATVIASSFSVSMGGFRVTHRAIRRVVLLLVLSLLAQLFGSAARAADVQETAVPIDRLASGSVKLFDAFRNALPVADDGQEGISAVEESLAWIAKRLKVSLALSLLRPSAFFQSPTFLILLVSMVLEENSRGSLLFSRVPTTRQLEPSWDYCSPRTRPQICFKVASPRPQLSFRTA